MSELGTDAEIDAAKILFAPYLAANEHSTIERVARGAGGARIAIVKPWEESGIAIFLQHDKAALANALNNLILPVPFTAIYHKDTRELEVIWTAYPIGGASVEVLERKFDIEFEGVKHGCNFGGSSARLLTIATSAIGTLKGQSA
jgi:hypothetical protein